MGKGRALKDDKEGWITVKGNAGTVYAEVSNNHYTIVHDTPLTKAFASTSETLRMLSKDEAMHATEKPQEEKRAPLTRVKVRAASDGAEGWVTKAIDTVRTWSVFHKRGKTTPITEGLEKDGKELRQIAVGETVELLDGPTEADGVLRIKGRAEKDGVVGWVTVKDSDGSKRFKY